MFMHMFLMVKSCSFLNENMCIRSFHLKPENSLIPAPKSDDGHHFKRIVCNMYETSIPTFPPKQFHRDGYIARIPRVRQGTQSPLTRSWRDRQVPLSQITRLGNETFSQLPTSANLSTTVSRTLLMPILRSATVTRSAARSSGLGRMHLGDRALRQP